MDQHKSGSVGAKSGSSIRKFLPRSPKNENQPLTLPSAAPNTTQEGPSYTQACAGIPRRMVRARGGLTGLGHLKVVCPGHRGVPLLSENIQLNYPHFWQYIIYKIIYIYIFPHVPNCPPMHRENFRWRIDRQTATQHNGKTRNLLASAFQDHGKVENGYCTVR